MSVWPCSRHSRAWDNTPSKHVKSPHHAGAALNILHVLTHWILTTNNEAGKRVSLIVHRRAISGSEEPHSLWGQRMDFTPCSSVATRLRSSVLPILSQFGSKFSPPLVQDFPAFSMQSFTWEISWEVQIPGPLPQGLLFRMFGMRSRNLYVIKLSRWFWYSSQRKHPASSGFFLIYKWQIWAKCDIK